MPGTCFAASKQRLQPHLEEREHSPKMSTPTELQARQYVKLAGHELRGSLNAITNVLEEVVADFAEEIPREAREALQVARDRCDRLTHVVESILADPEHAGKPQWMETKAVLNEVQSRVAIYAEGRDVTLTLPERSVRVWADPVALREVFANLVSNAAHHLDKPKGEIRVEHSRSGDAHIFTVADDGPGIPREQQAEIFQPFYRTGSQQHQGKGLGLYFVRRIVEQHGGQAWVESVAGAGSRFSFSLPAKPSGRIATDLRVCPETQSLGCGVGRECGVPVGPRLERASADPLSVIGSRWRASCCHCGEIVTSRLGGSSDLLEKRAVSFRPDAELHVNATETCP